MKTRRFNWKVVYGSISSETLWFRFTLGNRRGLVITKEKSFLNARVLYTNPIIFPFGWRIFILK